MPRAGPASDLLLTFLLTYVLAGPRVSEGCGIDGVHLDLTGHPGRLRIAGTRTSAGDRSVPLLPGLRDALLDYRRRCQRG